MANAQPTRNRSRRPDRGRIGLGALLAFLALNAIGGGLYGLLGARGVPRAWLAHSPFSSYFLPSLILLAVVGGIQLAASVAVLACARQARALSGLAGGVLLGWIAAQLLIIGPVSWLQPAVAVAGLAVLLLGSRLPDG